MSAVIIIKNVPRWGGAPSPDIDFSWTDGNITGSRTLTPGEEIAATLESGQVVRIAVMGEEDQ